MAQDPEINAYQQLVEDFQYKTGDALAFVTVKINFQLILII